jgi:hypothetical protein
MAALAARLREHMPTALWRELEPLLEAEVDVNAAVRGPQPGRE